MANLKRKLNLPLNSKKKKFNENTYQIAADIHKNTRLNIDHLNKSCYELANFLLGKLIVRQIENILLKGRIVETECYLGGEDKASHSYNGRRTPGNEPMYMDAGSAYVYKIYGMYHCFNISSKEPGGAVLIRALEPIDGINKMQEMRNNFRSKQIKLHELCKGPSKLCISMNITKENSNKLDLCRSSDLWLEFDESFSSDFTVVTTSRIGINSAGEEWTNKPLRFYIKGNLHVSKRDREREKELST